MIPGEKFWLEVYTKSKTYFVYILNELYSTQILFLCLTLVYCYGYP